MNLQVRRGQIADAQTIASFQIAMALETEDKRLDPQVVLPAVRSVFDDDSKGFYLVAEIDGIVVGGLMITYEWSDWRNCDMWYIQSVFVQPQSRGRGVFSALYARVIEMAREAGTMFVRLYVEIENERAQRTYERLGMKRMPYYLYDAKIDS